MAREIPGMPGMVQLDDADLTPQEQALVAQAEAGPLDDFDHSTIQRGEEAATSGQALVEAARGGPENLRRALGGRPPLDPNAQPGEHAKARQVRLPQPLSDELDRVAKTQGRKPSALIREAVARYLEAC